MIERHSKQFKGAADAETAPDDEMVTDLSGGETADGGVVVVGADKRDLAGPAKNVAELMNNWQTEYDETKDLSIKQELAYKMLRMTMALEQARLSAKNVQIEAFEGALGVYFPDGTIGITPEGLDSPPEHWEDIMVHEAAHAGKVSGGRRLMDESIAEYFTVTHVAGAEKGVYEAEQAAAKRAFGDKMKEAVELYDFDNPVRLARMYLVAKMEEMWANELEDKLRGDEEIADPKHAEKIMRQAVESSKEIEKLFEEAVPDLHDQLTAGGYNFTEVELEILKALYTKEF
ncbi:MAG: hypothetical protein WC675_01610 [Patescibacteria group bacterium]|jgi:hypothetical protein